MATNNSLKKEMLRSEVKFKSRSKKIHEPQISEIFELAETLYANRLENGEPATATIDWQRAEAYLRRTI